MKLILCIFVTIAMVLGLFAVFPATAQEAEHNPTTTGTISGTALYDGGHKLVNTLEVIDVDNDGIFELVCKQ